MYGSRCSWKQKVWVWDTYELILVSKYTSIGDVLLDGYGCTVAKKVCRDTREKNTDRDDVGRECTRHVQMQKRLTVEKERTGKLTIIKIINKIESNYNNVGF